MKKKSIPVMLLAFFLLFSRPAYAGENRLEPVEVVPDYVSWLLETAGNEVGYREGDHGYSKYGEWAGDPYAQWCAEFLCWCVDPALFRTERRQIVVYQSRTVYRPERGSRRMGV